MKLLRSRDRRVNWLQPAAQRSGSEAISSLPRYLTMPNEANVFGQRWPAYPYVWLIRAALSP
jgi:hypothetical protein